MSSINSNIQCGNAWGQKPFSGSNLNEFQYSLGNLGNLGNTTPFQNTGINPRFGNPRFQGPMRGFGSQFP